MKSSQGDAIESFAVKHSLLWNQLGRFSFVPKNVKTDTLTKRNSKSSPTPTAKQFGSDTLNRVSNTHQNTTHGLTHSKTNFDGG
jgi:hypothetical protein